MRMTDKRKKNPYGILGPGETRLSIGIREYNRRYQIGWRKEHPEWKLRKYQCRLGTTIDGKKVYIYGIVKRPKPASCELCHRSYNVLENHLHYHHWDDNHPEIGMWICVPCHWFAEKVESGLVPHYFELKEKILASSKMEV